MKEDKVENDSLMAFREVTRELDNHYSYFPKSCGLSEPEYWSLLLIDEGIETQSAISEQMYFSRQTLNSAFKQLIKKGFIVLEPYEDNLRSKRAVLTDVGKGFIDDQVKKMHGIEEAAWQQLTSSEQEQLLQLTRKYADVLKEILETQKDSDI